MNRRPDEDTRGERSSSGEELFSLLLSANPDRIGEYLDRTDMDESLVSVLLTRRDLSGELLERIALRKEWVRSRRIQCELVAHPRTPRWVVIRLARDLYLMDLLAIARRSSAAPDVRRLAGEILVARIPHLPLGEKLVVARRGPARVAGALLAEGHERVVRAALDNGLLTEAQLLRALADEALPGITVKLIAQHAKWSLLPRVRVALVRHPHAVLADVSAFLSGLHRRDLIALSGFARLCPEVHDALMREIAARKQ